jgi:excisionase family DNA binding protein
MSTVPSILAPLDPLQRYTVEEAIRYLRTSRQSIYNLIDAGRIATINQGKRRFVPGSEIARLSRVETAKAAAAA